MDDAPDKSEIVDGTHNSSSATNLYHGICQNSSDIDEGPPEQPTLKCYDPKKFGSESFSRDFNPAWYKPYPWLSYNCETKKPCCYPCHGFTFDNWKKLERLTKHHMSENHQTVMTKWIDSRANKKRRGKPRLLESYQWMSHVRGPTEHRPTGPRWTRW